MARGSIFGQSEHLKRYQIRMGDSVASNPQYSEKVTPWNISGIKISQTVIRFVYDYAPKLTIVLGTAITTLVQSVIATNWSQSVKLWVTPIGLTILFLGQFWDWHYSKRVSDLQAKLDEYNSIFEEFDYNSFFDHELYLLSTRLGYGHKHRISLYHHDENSFVMIGRYSSDPEFRKKGRVVYPDNQGCIAEAWRSGHAFTKSPLPDPNASSKKYAEHTKNLYYIPLGVTNKLAMKSRMFAGFRIDDSTKQDEPVAVIIFECLEPDGIDFKQLKSLMDSEEACRICHLIQVLKPLKTVPSLAKKEEM